MDINIMVLSQLLRAYRLIAEVTFYIPFRFFHLTHDITSSVSGIWPLSSDRQHAHITLRPSGGQQDIAPAQTGSFGKSMHYMNYFIACP